MSLILKRLYFLGIYLIRVEVYTSTLDLSDDVDTSSFCLIHVHEYIISLYLWNVITIVLITKQNLMNFTILVSE